MDVRQILFSPLVPNEILIGLVVAALLALLLGVWRQVRGLYWRFLAFAGVITILANPILVQENRKYLSDVVLLLTDQSLSQQLDDRITRSREWHRQLTENIQEIPGIELRVVETSPQNSAQVAKDGTKLIEAASRMLIDVPPDRLAATILISDGQVHDIGKDFPPFAQAPVHLLLTGRRDEKDRRIVVVNQPAFGLVGKEVSLQLKVVDQADQTEGSNDGAENSELAEVSILFQDGRKEQRRVVIDQIFSVNLPIQHAGENLVEVMVAPLPNELYLENNHNAFAISGVRDRLRVLLISGEPHAGERVWRNLLKSDPAVDLVHFTILRPPTKKDDVPPKELSLIAFPTRQLFQDKLSDFDLIIFDRYRRSNVLSPPYFENIAEYVRQGGALLVAAGADYASSQSLYRTPLVDVLAATPTGHVIDRGFRPQITATGLKHPVTSGLLSANWNQDGRPRWGRWFRMVEVDVQGGETLMTDEEQRPLLQVQRVGEGRVAQLMSDHAWLWAREIDGGGPYAEMLRRIAHWLMREPELEEENLSLRYSDNRLLVERRSLDNHPKQVTLTDPAGKEHVLELETLNSGEAIARFDQPSSGIWRVWDGTRRAVTAVGQVNPLELSDVRASPEKLKPLIQASGGGIFWPHQNALPRVRETSPNRPAFGSDWLGLKRNKQYQVTDSAQRPLIPLALALPILLALVMLGWWRENR